MRRFTLILAAAAAIALTAGTAQAGHGHRGPHGSWGYRYGGPAAWSYRYGPTQGQRLDGFGRAAREVRESHSRYRYYSHPRSNYNQPPWRYQHWGW